MATHSSVLAWRIPGTGETGGLLSMGSHRVRHDWSDLAAAAAWTEWLREIAKLTHSLGLKMMTWVFELLWDTLHPGQALNYGTVFLEAASISQWLLITNILLIHSFTHSPIHWFSRYLYYFKKKSGLWNTSQEYFGLQRNKSILDEINPEYSLEALMLKLQ